jgi:hypothetical protein
LANEKGGSINHHMINKELLFLPSNNEMGKKIIYRLFKNKNIAPIEKTISKSIYRLTLKGFEDYKKIRQKADTYNELKNLYAVMQTIISNNSVIDDKLISSWSEEF